MPENDRHQGRIFLHRGDLVQARRCYEQSVVADRTTGDVAGLTESLGNLGNVCAMQGDFTSA